ncbi:MAG: ECF-type sigma factor [Planctomycetota bacterium]
MTQDNEVTRLLEEIRQGDQAAGERLLPLVYDELRKLARSRLSRERPGQTLQPTALVHEAYLRLVGDGAVQWDGRGHFFAAAAEAMRRILIDRARRYAAIKHGGDQQRVGMSDVRHGEEPVAEEVLAIDQALTRLEALDEQMAMVVKLRYFAGLSVEETARAMGISPRGVKRHWAAARAWLRRAIGEADG